MTEPRLTCRECVEFLMDYLDDGLAPDVRVTFERHLAACANCLRYLESYKTTTDHLQEGLRSARRRDAATGPRRARQSDPCREAEGRLVTGDQETKTIL